MSHGYTAPNGQRYIYQCSRFRFDIESSTVIREELNAASDIDGAYAHIRRESSVTDATLSQSPGLPLGEAVHAHLGGLSHLVWCEELEDAEGQCLVVLVKNGRIEVDALVSAAIVDDSIRAEIMTSEEPFAFFVRGNTPFTFVGEPENDGALKLPDNLVSTLEVLHSSILNEIDVDNVPALVPLKTALKQAGLNASPLPLAAGVVAVIAVLGFVFFGGNSEDDVAQPRFVPDPFADYRNELSRQPTADALVSAVYANYLEITSMKGWIVKEMSFTSGKVHVAIENAGDSELDSAMEWLRSKGWTVTFPGAGISIYKELSNLQPHNPNAIQNVDQVIARLHDDFLMLSRASLGIENTQSKDLYKKAFIKFGAEGMTLPQWKYLVTAFADIPIVIQGMRIVPADKTQTVAVDLVVIGN